MLQLRILNESYKLHLGLSQLTINNPPNIPFSHDGHLIIELFCFFTFFQGFIKRFHNLNIPHPYRKSIKNVHFELHSNIY